MRLGLRSSNEALHVLGADQHGFVRRDNRGVCSPPMPMGGPRRESSFVLWNCLIKMLIEGFQTARLETRTKESNMYASWWVVNPRSVSNLTWWEPSSGGAPSTDHELLRKV